MSVNHGRVFLGGIAVLSVFFSAPDHGVKFNGAGGRALPSVLVPHARDKMGETGKEGVLAPSGWAGETVQG